MLNRNEESLSEEVFNQIRSMLLQLEQTLSAKLAALTDKERDDLLSMEVDNFVFSKEAYQEAVNHGAGILPAYINIVNLGIDLLTYAQLDELRSIVENILRIINDGARVAGHEAFTAANQVYQSFAMATNAGVPGAKAPYTRLGERYRVNRSGGRGQDKDA